MSEFTEIMRQAERLCAAYGGMCGMRNCPLNDENACCILPDQDCKDYNELERIIMDWAAEHPEPVYPSWEDGWRQLFPESSGTPCPANYGKKYRNICCLNTLCVNCKQSPMPAEVAEKLGIKPIAPKKPPKHDCDTCKFERRKSTDEPCVRCKHCIDCEESILTAPDLWEEAENGQ